MLTANVAGKVYNTSLTLIYKGDMSCHKLLCFNAPSFVTNTFFTDVIKSDSSTCLIELEFKLDSVFYNSKSPYSN